MNMKDLFGHELKRNNVDEEWSKQLYNAVQSKLHTGHRFNLNNWARSFSKLRGMHPIETIQSTLTAYCRAIQSKKDRHLPKAYSAKAFAVHFDEIQSALTHSIDDTLKRQILATNFEWPAALDIDTLTTLIQKGRDFYRDACRATAEVSKQVWAMLPPVDQFLFDVWLEEVNHAVWKDTPVEVIAITRSYCLKRLVDHAVDGRDPELAQTVKRIFQNAN